MTHDNRVTIVGCGNMGSALARTLAGAGYEVTAWNRTHARAEALAGPYITPCRSVHDAFAATDTVVACVAVYDSLITVLGDAGELAGKTLINLTTGSPAEAQAMAARCRDADVNYLDGVITVYPRQIGNRDAQILLSGSSELWERHRAMLEVLGGGARHVSETPSAGNVLDVSLVGAFYMPALTSFIEAARYALEQGVEPDTLLTSALPLIHLLEGAAEEAIRHISSGRFDHHDASVAVFAEAARAMGAEVESKGCSAHLLAEAARIMGQAEEAGLADKSLSSIVRVLV